MSFKLETERLYLREIIPDDDRFAYELNLDEEVIRYTGDGHFENMEEARAFLEKYDHYQKYGFGRWAVVRKSDNEILGWCGLKYTEDLDEHDIGFRFFKKHWNSGYATESAAACLKIGFEKFGMKTIVGRARVENVASVRVLEKLGLTYSKSYEEDGENWVVYTIDHV